MIKINYKIPDTNESKEDIARANIIISDKFKKRDYLEMSCISWLKLDSNRDYQELEQLFRYLDLDSHVIAQPLKTISDDLEIYMPNKENFTEKLEYVAKISCKSKEDSLKELLLVHSGYEENFECLKKTGCLMAKKNTSLNKVDEKILNYDEINQKKILECELKLDFTYYKPSESINCMIENLTIQYGTKPEKIVCGEINGNKVFALWLNKKIISPIGWIEKYNNIKTESDENIQENLDYELIDFRNIKVENS